jgi:hypothetical protein
MEATLGLPPVASVTCPTGSQPPFSSDLQRLSSPAAPPLASGGTLHLPCQQVLVAAGGPRHVPLVL